MSSDNRRVNVDDIESAPESLPDPEAFDPALFSRVNSDFTRVSDENFRNKELILELRSKLSTKVVLDDLVKPMATRSFVFMCCYAGFVGFVILLSGFGACVTLPGVAPRCFVLPQSVLNLLVGSTAVTVIGLVGMVLTGVFVGARK